MSKKHTIPWHDDYYMGAVVDAKTGKIRPNPMSIDSIKTFKDSFQAKEEKNDATPGEYSSNSTLATTIEQHEKELTVGANLDVEYGPVSTSVSAKFVRENTASSLDISFIFHAKTTGSSLTGDTTDLKVSDKVAEFIKTQSDKLTLSGFIKMYGDVIIIGKEYSGEILISKQYSFTTQNSKQNMGASLEAQYGKAGFRTSGQAMVDSQAKGQTDNVKTKLTAKFIGCDPDSDAAKKIIECVKSVGGSNEDKNWSVEVEKNALEALTIGKLIPNAAIILPIKAIPAMNVALMEVIFNSSGDDDDAVPSEAIKRYPLLNAVFYAILSIQKGAGTMNSRLQELRVDLHNEELHDEAGNLIDFIAYWQDKLLKLKTVLVQAGEDDELLEKWQKETGAKGGSEDDVSKKMEKEILDDIDVNKDDFQDDSKDPGGEIDKDIPYVSAPLLKNEWFNKVVIKYNDIMNRYTSPSDKPTIIEAKDINLTGQYYQGQALIDNTDIITCGNDVKNVMVNITWNDQKWGNLKGEIWMRILRAATGEVADYSVGKATHKKSTISKQFPNQDGFTDDKLPKKGDQVSFVRLIGGGGGHELHIETFKATINWK